VKLEDELEMMERLHPDGAFSLRLWVVGSPAGGTTGHVDWVVSASNGFATHAVKLGRFTWNGDLDLPMRGIILAREMISTVYDKLPPIAVR
jgi:hypothetical protein